MIHAGQLEVTRNCKGAKTKNKQKRESQSSVVLNHHSQGIHWSLYVGNLSGVSLNLKAFRKINGISKLKNNSNIYGCFALVFCHTNLRST